MGRKISTKGLKKKAWEAFAKWVREKDLSETGYGICVTCKTETYKRKLNAGHFIHGHSKMTFMDERNVHPQCVGCNLYKSGNLIEYASFMKETYGWETIDALRELSHKIWKPSRQELEDIINHYNVLLNEKPV